MSKVIATELNAIIQNYLYEKLGEGAEFTVQYNPDHVRVWVKLSENDIATIIPTTNKRNEE